MSDLGTSPVPDSYFQMVPEDQDQAIRDLLLSSSASLEGNDNPTVLCPEDAYELFEKQPELCAVMFNIHTIEQVDEIVKNIYLPEFWPERLKNLESK